MAGYYLAFSFLLPIGKALKPFLGEVADVLQIAAYFWPYPVLLALQSWPAAQGLWPMIIVAGLLIVLGFATIIQKRFPVFSEPKRWAHVLALVLWYIPVFVAQGLVILVIWSLGYPIGA